MGGSISAESTPGKGSKFEFTVTLEKTELQAPAPQQPESVADARVLVVDDNATNRLILEEMLSNWGMRPTTAARAADAIDLLKVVGAGPGRFGLMISDVNMPECDGFELVEKIRQNEATRDLPVILLTSGGRQGDAQRARQLNVAAQFIKPANQSELFDAIVSALGGDTKHRAAVSRPEALPELPSMHVLLAEDSVINQKLAVGLLTRHGHTVSVFCNGAEAVAALKSGEEQFDLVLMDVQMPVLDGLKATGQIREWESTQPDKPPSRIVAMTAHAMKGDRERCLAAGMDEYLSKPVRSLELFTTMQRMCEPDAATTRVRQPAPEAAPQQASPEQASQQQAAPEQASQQQAAPEPQSATAPQQPVLDWEVAMDAVGGSKELLVEVLEAVLVEVPEMQQLLAESLTADDITTARRAAHTIKGALRMFGETAAGQAAKEIEALAADGRCAEAAQRQQLLHDEIAAVLPQLVAFVQGNDMLT